MYYTFTYVGRDSSQYSDSLQTERSGDRILVGGDTFYIHPEWPWGPHNLL
jgi:hypothetical protein